MKVSRLCAALLCLSALAQKETPRHFLNGTETLTAASSTPPRGVAEDYIRSVAPAYGLEAADLAGAALIKEYTTEHNGVTHLIYRQYFGGMEVFNSDFTVNIDRYGRVLNAGGTLYSRPADGVQPPETNSAMRAVREAVQRVNPRLGERYLPAQKEAKAGSRYIAFHPGNFGEIETRPIWYGVNGTVRPAWLFYVLDANGVDYHSVIVESSSGVVLSSENLTSYQNPPRGLVFERASPQPNPQPGVQLTEPPLYVERTLQSFAGDPIASPRGWVTNNETAGNNTITGLNPEGVIFLTTPRTAVAVNGEFRPPLELGPGKPAPSQFGDAATVNLFYWINRSHDLFYAAGFNEAAGNYQVDNFSKGGNGGDPIYSYSQFGSANPANVQLNNAFYQPRRDGEDGLPAIVSMFLGTGDRFFVDGSYDNEVVIHEYTHGVTNRLVRQLRNFQMSAMNEATSDFFSLEFTVPEGTPIDGVYPQGEYLFQSFGTGVRSRPYTTNMELNPLTYADIGHVLLAPQIHNDGIIWVSALWEVRANLIRQFGEREGRRKIRLLVIDGMKLCPPSPTMVDMRDAILLADRAGFAGASQQQIWAGFARRGLGALAFSGNPNTVHVVASTEVPSPVGSLRFYEPRYVIGETVRVILQDSNHSGELVPVLIKSSSGDLESLQLRKLGSIFVGSIPSSGTALATRNDAILSVMPGDTITAYYTDANTGAGARQFEINVDVQPPYAQFLALPQFSFSNERALNFRGGFNAFGRFDLPFEFPYFNRRYSSLLLFTSGMLAFDLPPGTTCTDMATLPRFNGIAPLWMELKTNGTAQPNEDIYVSRPGADAITFRWAAEVETFTGQPGEPVNFAVTLFQDGRIRFHYGSGNINLANGLPFAGCSTSTPTVGLSNGNETFIQVAASHHGQGSLEDAPMIEFAPPFNHSSIPAGILESPAAGETVRDLLTLRGIAYDTAAPVARIDVLIDGRKLVRSALNTPRPDFCATRSAVNCPMVGFTTNVNLAALGIPPGAHTIQLRVTNTRGAFSDFPEQPLTFLREEGQGKESIGEIEAPAPGATVSGATQIRGWTANTELRLQAVDILIDGITYGRAVYGAARPDVCGGLTPRPPNCNNVGFTFALNTTSGIPLSNGEHTLQVRVLDESGRYSILPRTVTFSVDNPARGASVGVLTTPRNGERVSGTITISGYAYDPDGRITNALLLIDGETRLTLQYGGPRPEECAQLSGVPACPNIGFEGQLNTKVLRNGVHSLQIVVVDVTGSATFFPSLIGDGINIVVDNP